MIITIIYQNGYPNKTRSLVGDAKFESIVRQDARKSLIEAAKENSTGNSL